MLASRPAAAGEDQPGSDERPQKADVLVVSEGEHEGQVIEPQDLKPGGPPLRAWPKDPKTSVIRNGSRLNEVLVVRLDSAELDDETRSRAADGIVAYSAICSHAGCPVTGWLKGAAGDNDVLKCFCHNSADIFPLCGEAGTTLRLVPAPTLVPASRPLRHRHWHHSHHRHH